MSEIVSREAAPRGLIEAVREVLDEFAFTAEGGTMIMVYVPNQRSDVYCALPLRTSAALHKLWTTLTALERQEGAK